jgi:ribonuclease P protein component
MPGLTLQARNRGDEGSPRVGFTATKKLGNAVVRNRVKRRLREIARQHLAAAALPGHDYVLIGRQPAFARTFADLEKDFTTALKRLHTARRPAEKDPS